MKKNNHFSGNLNLNVNKTDYLSRITWQKIVNINDVKRYLHNRKQKMEKNMLLRAEVKDIFYCLAELDDVKAHTKAKSWDPSSLVGRASRKSRIGTSNSSNAVPYKVI